MCPSMNRVRRATSFCTLGEGSNPRLAEPADCPSDGIPACHTYATAMTKSNVQSSLECVSNELQAKVNNAIGLGLCQSV